MRLTKWVLAFATALELPAIALAGDARSVYAEATSDRIIGNADTTILSSTISLDGPSWVYIQSDGRVYPSGGASISSTWATVDGAVATNGSVVDWSVSKSPRQHSYNVIGAVLLQAGSHTIALHTRSLNSATFSFGANSNLSVLVNPAQVVNVATVGVDTGTLTYNVNGLTAQSVIPVQSQANSYVTGDTSPLVAIASSRIYRWGNAGDPLTTIGLDGGSLPNNQANWSDNDMYDYAENQAPFFTHAFIPSLANASHTVSLLTSSLPYDSGNNTVQYRMGGDSRLITLQKGMTVVGSAPLANDAHNVANYLCIGTNIGWSGCPNIGTAVPIAEADINIPQGHNGIVLITGKTRVQADSADAGGQVFLYLTVDGTARGSVGVQELGAPSSVSTRTLGTSYLATGANALSVGTHHVVLYGQATGSFMHLAMTRDLPLMWFD